jgi:hypothetical protein
MGVMLLEILLVGAASWLVDVPPKTDPGPARPGAEKSAAPKEDVLILKDGKQLSGTLLDIQEAAYVLRNAGGKVFVARKDVAKLERADHAELGLFFKKADTETKTADAWRKLAQICARKNALPEERECWRRVLKLTPDDAEAHTKLGEALLDGKWILEPDVDAKVKEGYRLVDGKLERKGTTTVAPSKAVAADAEKKKAGTGSSAAGKLSKKSSASAKTIRAEDHLAKVLEEKDAHSLWMLLSRSGVRSAKLDDIEDEVDLPFARKIIESMSMKKGQYKDNMLAYLKKLGAPRDWEATNKQKVEEFLKQNPKGIHLETKYYHILSTSSKEVTQELGQKMDIVTAQVYQKIFEFEEKIPYKYVLIFWKDMEEFMKHGGPPMAAAYYRPDTKDLVGFNLRASGLSSMDPYQTLFHEGWHQYFDFYIPNAPRWFDEGFADVIYPTVIKGGKAIWKGYNAQRSSDVGQAASRGALIPLRELIKMDHGTFYDPQRVQLAYAQAWSFIYFLTTYKNSSSKTQERVRNFYKDYFWELHKGTDPVQAVDIVFKDVKFDTLEAAWIQAIPRQK